MANNQNNTGFNARFNAAHEEYNYIVGIDWRNPGADFNYDPECFLRYCDMQANSFVKHKETSAIGEDIKRFTQAARAIGHKATGLTRAQCQQILVYFGPYTQMEASKVIGSCSYEDLNTEINHWLAMGGF